VEMPIENPVENLREPDLASQAGSQLLSKILAPAVRLWLRSQIEAAASLEFQISGRNRQLLQGRIPAVQVNATAVVYQGLHLDQVQLRASQIQINLNQLLQGKPLRLLETVPVIGQVCLTQADLNASGESPLLHQALSDLLKILLQLLEAPELAELSDLAQITLQYPNLVLGQNQITLITELISQSSERWHLTLQTALHLVEPAQLQLSDLTLEIGKLRQAPAKLFLQPLDINLGQAVNLQKLEITPTQIKVEGQVDVVP
jgi:LmeA-like phospholipid-binding